MDRIHSLAPALICEAGEYDIKLSYEQASALLDHLALVVEKNKQLNLTRITSPQEAMRLHILDSLLFLPYIEDCAVFLDLGTGAGFPGIPILICSQTNAVLLDSVQKKVRAVDEFITALDLSSRTKTCSERVEAYASTNRGRFDVVTARAVAQLDVLVEYASPLLHIGGSLVCSKGHLSDDELSRGLKAADVCGMELLTHDSFELPEHSGHREIVVFSKHRKARVRLPRKVGDAKKSPLSQE